MLIARALVGASQNILLDEPCSALDLANQQLVLQLISDLAHRQKRTVLFTTHDPTHALQVANQTLLLLPDGEWLAGESAAVLTEANLQRAYGLAVRKVHPPGSALPLLAPQGRLVYSTCSLEPEENEEQAPGDARPCGPAVFVPEPKAERIKALGSLVPRRRPDGAEDQA